MTLIVVKKVWNWLKHFWYVPILFLVLIFTLLFGWKRNQALIDIINLSTESYKKQLDVINETHKKEISKITDEFAFDANLFEYDNQHVSNNCIELAMANVTESSDGVQIANYLISIEPRMTAGSYKNYYSIRKSKNKITRTFGRTKVG